MTASRFSRVLRGGLWTIALAAAAAAAVNYWVNPLFLYRDGLSVLGPLARRHFHEDARMAKPLIIATRQPDALVLGNSRAELAFDPDHPLLAPGYNAGLSGGTLSESGQLLMHGLRVSEPRLVVVAINPYRDFFLRNRGGPARVENWPLQVPWRLWFALRGAAALASPRQTWRSLQALVAPAEYAGGKERVHEADGQRAAAWAQRDLARFGHHGLFRTTLKQMFRDSPQARFLKGNEELIESWMAGVPENTQVILVAEPIHAVVYAAGESRQDMYDRAGDGVRAMVEAAGSRASVWDCSGSSEQNSEPVPPRAAKGQRMRWWLEASHYAPAYGNAILDQIRSDARNGPCVRIAPETLAAYSQRRASEKLAVLQAGKEQLSRLGRAVW